MNLVKIFDLVKCSRNNVSCNADILTIDDARNKYKMCIRDRNTVIVAKNGKEESK